MLRRQDAGYWPPRDVWRRPQDYGTRPCPTCDGRGLNPRLPWLICPKCHGEKRVSDAR